MTEYTDLITDEDASLPEPAEQPSGLFAGFTEVTWAIVGTGFLLGILIGSIFIVGRGGSSCSLFAGSSCPEPEAVATAPSAPSQMKPVDTSDLTAERESLTHELEAEKLRLEVAALRQELTGLRSPTNPVESVGSPATPASTSARLPTQPVAVISQGEATLAYWNHLNALILQEAAMRAAPAGGVTASNADGFLEARMQAAEFAAVSIRELETDGVDRSVHSLSEALAAWYQDGHDVAKQGLHLLTKASPEERQGSVGMRYQAAERSHSTAVNEINSEGERVRQSMTQKYRLNFPPLN